MIGLSIFENDATLGLDDPDNWPAEYPPSPTSTPTGGGSTAPAPTAPPEWAIGQFYSTDGRITLAINASGGVAVVNAGVTYYGTFANNTIFVNNDLSDIVQEGDGVRTFNRSSSIYTSYRRTPPVNLPAPTGTPTNYPTVTPSPSGTMNYPTITPTPSGTVNFPTITPAPAGQSQGQQTQAAPSIGGIELNDTTLLIGGAAVVGLIILMNR